MLHMSTKYKQTSNLILAMKHFLEMFYRTIFSICRKNNLTFTFGVKFMARQKTEPLFNASSNENTNILLKLQESAIKSNS